jgi:hypothetical protein
MARNEATKQSPNLGLLALLRSAIASEAYKRRRTASLAKTICLNIDNWYAEFISCLEIRILTI